MQTIRQCTHILALIICALAFSSCANITDPDSCRIHKIPTQQKNGYMRNMFDESTPLTKDETDFLMIYPPIDTPCCYNQNISPTKTKNHLFQVVFPWCPECQAAHDKNKATFKKLTPAQRAAAREKSISDPNSALNRSLNKTLTMDTPKLDLPPPPKDLSKPQPSN